MRAKRSLAGRWSKIAFSGWALALGLAVPPAALAADRLAAGPLAGDPQARRGGAGDAPWPGHPAIVAVAQPGSRPAQVWLEAAPGNRIAVPVPPGGTIEAAELLADGWVAAGSEPAKDGTEILLLAGRGGVAGELPPPRRQSGALRLEALPLVEDGRLAGLVWLEGATRRTLAVRYASWNGTDWQDEQLISPPGPGSQLALTAARLSDGAWLLAWSAFDGVADQIVWSLRRGGAWTSPRPVRPAAPPGASSAPARQSPPAPNITPDLAPLPESRGGGALIAWSRLEESGYRVVTARFGDGQWQQPVVVGPPGSLYPRFVAGLGGSGRAEAPGASPLEHAVRMGLLYRTAAPRGRMRLDLDGAGQPQGVTALPDEGQVAASPAAASAQQHYIAFGDSITAGRGDTQTPSGYPPRLELLLAARGVTATVENDGLFGETTGEGLSRLDGVLAGAPGAAGLLLMEGTNDINQKVSIETITTNLGLMAQKAQAAGIPTVHATVVPRLPDANTDGSNMLTGELAAGIRELAWESSRKLADPFEVFFYLTPHAIPDDYAGDGDRLHPNAAGYDLLAQTLADALTNADTIPPVTGLIQPPNGQQNVPANTSISLVLYDFGTGIDLSSVQLSVNGQAVSPMTSGDKSKLVLAYSPPQPLVGIVDVHLHAQDHASPPNVLDRLVSEFIIAGTTFLPGDINRDGRVDGADLVILALAFGAHRYDSNYNQAADLNGDGIVDGLDLAILAANFGKTSF
jgi:lysophospholipase L1-like esterase